MRLSPRLAIFALTVAATAACSGQSGTAVPRTDSTTTSAVQDSESVDAPYTATSATVSGVRGTATYDVKIPQIEGPDQEVVSEFNESIRTYVESQIDQEGTFTLTGTSQKVILGNEVVAGVVKMEFMSTNPMGAHPYGLVGTVVIRKSNAEPVMLEELFTDFDAGLTRLAEVSDVLVREKIGDATFASGLAPEAINYANWVPTATGIEIHFDDGQVGPHAAGMVTIEVPWSDLDDVLAEKLY